MQRYTRCYQSQNRNPVYWPLGASYRVYGTKDCVHGSGVEARVNLPQTRNFDPRTGMLAVAADRKGRNAT